MKKLFIISASVLINMTSFAADKDNRQVSPFDHKSPELAVTFRAIQDIHGLAAETAKDFKAHGVRLQLGVKGWPGSGPDYNQTKEGLFLVCSNSHPIALKTPWGKVSIFGTDISPFYYDESKLPKIFDAFSKMLTLSLDGIEGEYVQGRKFFVLDKDGAKNEITKEKFLGLHGSDKRVLTNCSDCAIIYKILANGNTLLPDPIKNNSEDYRKYKTVKESWKTMMAQHEKEMRVLKAIEDAKK